MPQGDGSGHRPLSVIGKLESPITTYYVILGVTLMLTIFGLIMVFSASSVTSLLADQAAYTVFARQLMFAVAGAILAAIASHLTVHTWKRLALPVFIGAVCLELAVFTPLGYAVNGNRNWINLGPVSMQPAEFAKVALVLMGALVFVNKKDKIAQARHAVVPYLFPVAALLVALDLAGKDLGTAMIMALIVIAVLAVAGIPGRFFAAVGTLSVLGVLVMVLTRGNRVARITNFLSAACQSNPDGACGQSVHGMYALADGGWWGVGLGASKEKWDWLSEAYNDFIFAILGEELGLPGTLLILALFAVLAWACYRLATRTQDGFVRIASVGIMVWLLSQAIINIGAVIGLFPIIGVPLPLLSAGGSSLVTTLIALGMLLSFARNEPGCREMLAARPSIMKRSLSVLPARLTPHRSR